MVAGAGRLPFTLLYFKITESKSTPTHTLISYTEPNEHAFITR